MIDRIMDRKQVAEFIGRECRADGKPVTQRTISRYNHMGLPRRKFSGRVTYRESVVREWLEREGDR